jgi:hypothetical protein
MRTCTFLPEKVLSKVWSYFDQAQEHYGMAWPVLHDAPARLLALTTYN